MNEIYYESTDANKYKIYFIKLQNSLAECIMHFNYFRNDLMYEYKDTDITQFVLNNIIYLNNLKIDQLKEILDLYIDDRISENIDFKLLRILL